MFIERNIQMLKAMSVSFILAMAHISTAIAADESFLSGANIISQMDNGTLPRTLPNSSYIDVGYFEGYVQSIGEFQSEIPSNNFCFPKGTTNGKRYSVVARFIYDYPQFRQYHNVALIRTALHMAFPCPK